MNPAEPGHLTGVTDRRSLDARTTATPHGIETDMTLTTTRPTSPNQAPEPASGPIARVVLASLMTGIVGALALTLGAFPGGAEYQIVGSTLVAFGAGWAVLALASTRFTRLPQRWAYVPAAVMSAAGIACFLLTPGDAAFSAAGWVWPLVFVGLAIWMARKIRRALPRRARWMLYPVVAVLAASALGGAVTTISAQSTSGQFPMPGHGYTVNGHQLHLDCTGTGSPTVVLENGLGLSSPAWASITDAVGTTTRVCAYDRAGQGWSEASEQPQDSRSVASDLHELLQAAGENGPYVLAAHSAGGAYSMTYAAAYPDDVAGLVLLDSMSPHQFTMVPAYATQYQMMRRLYGVAGPLSRIGFGPLLADASSDLPEGASAELHAIQVRPRTHDNAREELSLYPQSLGQAQALTSLGAKPLIVVTTTESIEESPGWSAAQNELAALSTNSSHRVADTSHVGVLMSTAGAEVSVRAITDIVRAVRTGHAVPQQ